MLKNAIKDHAPGILGALAGFVRDSATQAKMAAHDHARILAHKLELADRTEIDALKSRIAELEGKLK